MTIATDISTLASPASDAPADTYTRWTDADSQALEDALAHPALAECPLTEMLEGFITGTAVSPFDGMSVELLRMWLDLFGLEWDKLDPEVTGPLEAIVQKRLDAILDSFDEALTAARAGGGAAGLEPLMTDWDVVFAEHEAAPDAEPEASTATDPDAPTDAASVAVTDSDDAASTPATPGRMPQTGELWARGLLLAEMVWRNDQWARLDKQARKEVEKRHAPIRLLAKPATKPLTTGSGESRQRARLVDEAISNLHTMHQITDEYYELLNLTPAPIIKVGTPGRNDPCECGSGKKYKKCCGA
jgi:SEC-C motif